MDQISILVSIKLTEIFLEEFDAAGMSPEDLAHYFIENIQSDFDYGSGVEFEILEVY